MTTLLNTLAFFFAFLAVSLAVATVVAVITGSPFFAFVAAFFAYVSYKNIDTAFEAASLFRK